MKTRAHVRPTQSEGGHARQPLPSPKTPSSRKTLSSRPQHTLPLAEGHAEWRDLVSHPAYNCSRIALILLKINQPGPANAFPTPTVFNGQVYMGTNAEIDVFGLCVNGVGGICRK